MKTTRTKHPETISDIEILNGGHKFGAPDMEKGRKQLFNFSTPEIGANLPIQGIYRSFEWFFVSSMYLRKRSIKFPIILSFDDFM